MRGLARLATFAAAALATAPSAAAAEPSVGMRVEFGVGARLGQPTPLRLRLQVSSAHPGVARELRLSYPRGLNLIGSGLGLTPCRRPQAEFDLVLTPGHGLAGCPSNSVIGRGRATGEVRIEPPRIRENATLTLLAGPLDSGRLQLVGLVEGVNPFGALLSYSGDIVETGGRYGGRITLRIPRIPDLPYDDTEVALLDIDVTVGARTITYSERDRGGRVQRWHPDGPILPSTCRPPGLPFRAEIDFSNGVTRAVSTRAACPAR